VRKSEGRSIGRHHVTSTAYWSTGRGATGSEREGEGEGERTRGSEGGEVVTWDRPRVPGTPYPILSNEFQSSDVLHGDFDEADQPRRRKGEAVGNGNGWEGELQSHSLTWGVRASCLSGNFGILQTRAPPSSTATVVSPAGGTTLLGSLCPPCHPRGAASPATDR